MNRTDYALSFVGGVIALLGMVALLEGEIAVAILCALLAWLGVFHKEVKKS